MRRKQWLFNIFRKILSDSGSEGIVVLVSLLGHNCNLGSGSENIKSICSYEYISLSFGLFSMSLSRYLEITLWIFGLYESQLIEMNKPLAKCHKSFQFFAI